MKIQLPLIPDLATFASAARPLRPSRVAKFIACPMSVVLVQDESSGNPAAQTGNILHDAAEHYHKCTGTEAERVEAGLAALERARAEFPEGDPEKARTIFRAYVADKENSAAKVLWVEEPVRLELEPAADDPTGERIVIAGTLDQVREDRNGRKRVWDIKTGEYLSGDESALEYLVQQAVYTAAAIKCLDASIEPGGLIWTPGYFRARTRVHYEIPLTCDDLPELLLTIPPLVSMIRAGLPVFRPSLAACKWCELKKAGEPWPKCRKRFRGLYGR